MNKNHTFHLLLNFQITPFSLCIFLAMDMKAVKEENAEEEDDDVPGKDGDDCFISLIY